MSGPYDLGSAIPAADISLQLTDGLGNPANASPAPVLTLTLPDNSTATPAVTNPATGTYTLTAPYVPAQSGHFMWTWTWTGTLTAATEPEDSFEVRVSPDPTIVSLAEARDILKIPAGDTSHDSSIRSYNQAITEWVEYACGPVVTRQVTEVIRASGRELILSYAPVRTDLGTTLVTTNRRDGSTTNGLVSITPLLTYGFMYVIDDLIVDGPSGQVRHVAGLPFFYSGDPYPQYKAVYYAGRKTIGWGIYEASKIALRHIWAVERGGVSSGAVSYGESETTTIGYGYAVPNRAIELLQPHIGKASKAAFA